LLKNFPEKIHIPFYKCRFCGETHQVNDDVVKCERSHFNPLITQGEVETKSGLKKVPQFIVVSIDGKQYRYKFIND